MRSSEFRKIINIVNEASGSSGSGRMSPISENIKISKLAAGYKDRAIGRERCGNCAHFINPEYCEVVEGLINPGGWCNYHDPQILEGVHGSGSGGSGRSSSAHSGRSGKQIEEKWDTETQVAPGEKGKYAGKNKSELLKAYNHLKDTGPHKQGSKEFGRMRELAFAIRAKGGWGKVKEE